VKDTTAKFLRDEKYSKILHCRSRTWKDLPGSHAVYFETPLPVETLVRKFVLFGNPASKGFSLTTGILPGQHGQRDSRHR
jgi:hypothetical protein